MGGQRFVLGLVGSPNRDGRTFQMVKAALQGASDAGARVELVQIADHVVEACKDCLPWVCQTNRKCSYADASFEYLSEKLLSCGAVVLGTPVYWWDITGMVSYLILKMFRVYARSAPLAGLPAVGIGIAGGTGNGLVSGLRPVYHFFQMMQMRGLEPLPATRFNWGTALVRAGELGATLAGMSGSRHPFAGLEERLLWYDALPYLSMSRAEERRLLADLTTAALPENADPTIARRLAQADALAARGERLLALQEVTRTYEAGVKLLDG
ncbi:MAG TPA: flavodoxin family protein [Candidatus Acidoferrum sp.]|nr:flavodoxin family protein [Candidatus Methylomirabilis sp.]HWU41648.1 flavodoxin family protein [Candidatus Acidoferrum sp.]